MPLPPRTPPVSRPPSKARTATVTAAASTTRAAPPPAPARAPRAAVPARESWRFGKELRRALTLVLTSAVIIAVPVGIAMSVGWLDLSTYLNPSARPLPDWLDPGPLRASTRDGSLVRLRVAMDAGNRSTKGLLQRQMNDVVSLLQVSVSARNTSDLIGPQGLVRLSTDMLERLNGFLAARGGDPLRSVVIQDFWYTQP